MANLLVTTIIIEDHVLFRDLLRKICETEYECRVLGSGETIRDGIALCRRCDPELVLLDIDLPDGNSLDLLSEFRRASPESRFLAVSALEDEYTMLRVLDSGLHGFVDKRGSSAAALSRAIGAVVHGDRYFSPSVTRVRERVFGDPRSWFKLLTPRQIELLRLIGSGSSNSEVAASLGLSPRTVETHRQLIMAKLGIHSVRDLIGYAIRHGLAKL